MFQVCVAGARLCVKTRRWGSDERGSVGVLFAIMLLVLLMSVAGALDLTRWAAARSHTLTAADAAVLAGARALQVDNEDVSGAIAAAMRYYKENTRNRRVVDDTIRFRTADENKAMQATGQAYIETPFLSIIGIARMPLIKQSEATIAEAVISSGKEAQVEIAMMLDVTGSMTGQKLDDLKAAAKDLIDIVMLPTSKEVRIALVPFSGAVRLERDLAARVVGGGPPRYKFTDRVGVRHNWMRDPRCATERTGPSAFTDEAPKGQDKLGPYYSSDGMCTPWTATLTPLTDSKSQLIDQIDSYEPGGQTAGHLGTAWAWYMLSPNWAKVMPAKSRAGPYGQTGLTKVAILMTDGEYNIQYCNGVMTSAINCMSPNGGSMRQAEQLCKNMKESGITVFTIGFDLWRHGDQAQMLEKCASNPANYFNAESGDALRQAFRDIAVRITPLRLTK